MSRAGSLLFHSRAANVRPLRRVVLVSGAVVVGLVLPSAPVAFAAGGDSGAAGTKQERLAEMKARAAKEPRSSRPQAGDRFQRLAVEHDPGKAVLSVTMRGGAASTSSIDAVTRSAKSHGGAKRRVFPKLGTVSVEVPEDQAEKFTATLRERSDVTSVKPLLVGTSVSYPTTRTTPATSPYLDAVSAPSAWDVASRRPWREDRRRRQRSRRSPPRPRGTGERDLQRRDRDDRRD